MSPYVTFVQGETTSRSLRLPQDPHRKERVMTESSCRCNMLNVLSGALATEYLLGHLGGADADSNRRVHTCPNTGVQWIEDRSATQYASSSQVLRRLP